VSKYLSLEFDPIDQPAATDPVERLTWCALRVRIGERFPSMIWDKELRSERKNLYLPAFPVVEWIVENWWSMLNELCSWETVPTSAVGPAQWKWLKRHCLRSTDSSLMLPALYIFHDGLSLRAEWRADPQGSMPNMPGEFVGDGSDQLDSDATKSSLTLFIEAVLGRVAQVRDARVSEITEHWRAIQCADGQEQDFCTLAGRMGIDPYDASEMTDELARFLEQTVTSPEDPLLRDLTEVARPDSLVQQWSWLSDVGTDLKLGSNPIELSFAIPARAASPPQFGYRLARVVRAAAQESPNSPLHSVESVAHEVLGRNLRIEDRNHVLGHGIRAIIGRSADDGDVVAAGPQPVRPDSRRFLNARSLYHALVTTRESHRLVTDAFSWDQKASRAFAAELLAPQQALANSISSSGADSSAIEELSHDFEVSTRVIERQLANAGICVSSE
jgi:hypothetical protein